MSSCSFLQFSEDFTKISDEVFYHFSYSSYFSFSHSSSFNTSFYSISVLLSLDFSFPFVHSFYACLFRPLLSLLLLSMLHFSRSFSSILHRPPYFKHFSFNCSHLFDSLSLSTPPPLWLTWWIAVVVASGISFKQPPPSSLDPGICAPNIIPLLIDTISGICRGL